MPEPKTFDTGNKVVGGGKYMHTWGQFQSDGRLVTNTNIFTRVKFAGFTGGVMVCLCDDKGNVIANGPLRCYSVDGTWMPGASNRTVEEFDFFDPSLLDRVVSVEVFEEICPHARPKEDIGLMMEICKPVAEIFSDFKSALG